LPCKPPCLECIGYPDNCTECIGGNTNKELPSCKCKAGFELIDGENCDQDGEEENAVLCN